MVTILTIAIGVFLGVFVLPIIVELILSAVVFIISTPLVAFMMLSSFLQPIFDGLINGATNLISHKDNSSSLCIKCKKSFKHVDFEDDERSIYCSYDCYELGSNYAFRRSMLITGIILVMIAFSYIH